MKSSRQLRLCDRAQDQVGQRVDRVLAVDRLTADGDVLVQRAAGAEPGVGPAADLRKRHGLQPQVREQLGGLVGGDAPSLDVGRVIRVDVLVEAAVGQAVAVGLDLQAELDQPDRLDGLAEGLGRLLGNLGQDPAHLHQFSATRFVRLGRGKVRCERCVAVGEGGNGVEGDQYRAVEAGLLQLVGIGEIKPGKE